MPCGNGMVCLSLALATWMCGCQSSDGGTAGSARLTHDPWGDVVDVHVAALSSPKPTMRVSAARALGRLGWGAEPATPGLILMLADSEWESRAAAAQALGKIGDRTPEIGVSLRALVDDPDERVRRSARDALLDLGLPADSGGADGPTLASRHRR